MIGCDLLSAVSVFLVLVALIFGSWYSLLLGTLVFAILSQFSQPSAMKLFKQHVPTEQLQGVMAMFQSLMAVFMVIGPFMGTFVYQRYGIEVSLTVTGVMFFGSAIILSLLARDSGASNTAETWGFKKELMDGLRYVGSNHALRALGTTFAVCGLAVGLIQPLMLFISIENLGQNKQFLQWLLMANGAAMLVGGSVIMGIAKKVKPQTLLAMGLLVSPFVRSGSVGP